MSTNNSESKELKEKVSGATNIEERFTDGFVKGIGAAIEQGDMAVESIDKELREQCIELYKNQGYSIAEIADKLKVSSKTIQRDIQSIRERNALTPAEGWFKQTLGECYNSHRLHYTQILRLLNVPDLSNAERIQLHFAAWRMQKEFIELMNKLGIQFEIGCNTPRFPGKFIWTLEPRGQT